jgi:5-enolpyruvylshikimate-3-phosphate synthase
VKTVNPFIFNHKIQANASKSHLQRALALSLLSEGNSILRGCDESNDVLACRQILLDLGCEIQGAKNLQIKPPKNQQVENLSISVGE